MSARHEDWFAFADDDLKFARVGLKEGFFTQVCFHSQQGVEKCLKGYLVFRKKPYPKTHGLLELVKQMPEIDLKKWHSNLAILEDYYVPIRYPDAAPGMKSSGPPSKEEAEAALHTAEEVFRTVTQV